MRVEVPDGDVVDRMTILEIKVLRLQRGQDAAQAELDVLREAWECQGSVPLEELAALPRLRAVNRALWEVEDALREHEQRGDFGCSFVELARSVYRLNDERAALKRGISEVTGSALVEQKSYFGGGASET